MKDGSADICADSGYDSCQDVSMLTGFSIGRLGSLVFVRRRLAAKHASIYSGGHRASGSGGSCTKVCLFVCHFIFWSLLADLLDVLVGPCMYVIESFVCVGSFYFNSFWRLFSGDIRSNMM